MDRLRFHRSCVDWPRGQVNALSQMIDDSRSISRETFCRNVDATDRKNIEAHCGYALHPSLGLMMAGDYHVTYWSSRLWGLPAYYFVWSATEFVFWNRGATKP